MKIQKFLIISALIGVSLTGVPLHAELLTPAAWSQLQASERDEWLAYERKSVAAAQADEAALKRELAENHLQQALPAPSGGDFKVKHRAGDPWFGNQEAAVLTETILSYQTPSGGWSKHLGFSKGKRQVGMQWSSQNQPGQSAHYLATFDNSSTTAQMQHLAGVWLATKREDCRVALTRGLEYILAAQFPNGGWPQVYPLEGGYHDNITLNDDSMTHVLELLHAIASGEPAYVCFSQEQRQRAAAALAAGLDCIIKLQVVHRDRKALWCAQYEPLTLKPTAARKMEPAAMSGLESANLLRFLMTIPQPSVALVECIEAGLHWLEQASLAPDLLVDDTEKKERTTEDTELRHRWARFYDLQTGKPIFPGRDGVIYDSYQALREKNEVGYDYVTSRPASVIGNGQKKWRKMLAQ